MTARRKPSSSAATASWLSVVRAYHLCDAVMGARLAALGVRVAEHEVLANLSRVPGMTQQALAQRCFIAKSHLSGVIVQMEADGLVRRESDPDDARAKRLSLTPEGAALAERTLASQREVVAVMTDGYGDAELARIEATMNDVSARLEAVLQAGAAADKAARRVAVADAAASAKVEAEAGARRLSPRASAPRSPRPSRARRG